VNAGRIIGAGLAIAGALIVALCLGVLYALDHEGRVHQDAIDQIERSDRVEVVRTALAELGHAARLVAASGSTESTEAVERAAGAIENGLGAMAPSSAEGPTSAAEIDRLARLAVLNARSVIAARKTKGAKAAEEPAREAERLSQEGAALLERGLDAKGALLNRDAAAQIRAARTMRIIVMVALASLLGLLAAMFMLFRAARRRERAALARIEQLAHFDSLTGLPNRALVNDRLRLETARARRSGKPFSVVLLDLDGFKAVNDTWGHAAGDEALKLAASRARSAMRGSDTVGRLGGDEFLAVLPETTAAGALALAQKLAALLREPYPLRTGSGSMSASIGVACFPEDADDEERLLQAADDALYRAKRHGKDRIERAVVAPASSAEERPA
jgi:diguanylate cyclase (GGDEF)-like protein